MIELCRKEGVEGTIIIPELEVLYWSGRPFPAPTILPPPKFCQIAVSKKRTYETLSGTALVPTFDVFSREQLMANVARLQPTFPCWIRDFSEGSTSGKGALLVHSMAEARAWVVLNPGINYFMVADFLPGRNFACHLLYDKGNIVKIASYERLEYFMARTVMSGISGNISRGRLINDERLVATSAAAVERILHVTGETMHGIVATDLREARDGTLLITEINLRHVAATYSFAAAGFNLAEAQMLLTTGRRHELGSKEMLFPGNNIILRDIDGAPVWRNEYRPLAVGEFVSNDDVLEGISCEKQR
jgi:carbamoyl-phosphate synthase large subunit